MHEIRNYRKVKAIFWEKQEKYFKMLSAEFAHRVVKVKITSEPYQK